MRPLVSIPLVILLTVSASMVQGEPDQQVDPVHQIEGKVAAPGADIIAYQPANWTSPLIPWGDTDDLNGPIVAPTSLSGFEDVYIHNATMNVGDQDAPGPYVQRIFIDDRQLPSVSFPTSYNSGDSLKFVSLTKIAGGRHTLWMRADFPDWDNLDTDPGNNYWAEQWVWTPQYMSLNSPRFFTTEGSPTAGWDAFVNPQQTVPELFFNCVGIRTPLVQAPFLDHHWIGVVVSPADENTNVDLQIHQTLSTGSKSGFDTAFITSAAGGLFQTEFVILRPQMLSQAQFDAGIIQGAGTTNLGTFNAMVTSSQYLGADGVPPNGDYGPWELSAGQDMKLFDIWLDAGNYGITLNNLDSFANLGLSLHGGASAFARNSDEGTSATASLEPAGSGEYIGITIGQAGYFALAVWKTDGAYHLGDASYTLNFETGAVSGVVPEHTNLNARITHASPNPFNPRTSVEFVLEVAGEIELAIYDLRGQMVKVLHQGHLTSGVHARTWQGRDESGRSVATGTYLVRLRTADSVDYQKIMLLK